MAIRTALLTGHYRADRPWSDGLLASAYTRLHRWRAAGTRAGTVSEDSVSAIREALADDLDTPTALDVLDRWAADESLDGALVADAADALLGITLK
jgi:L-cysteine:1D-myo-inositol 2-amino-2-deoxy-alpha-D-glucopyranoside ligase